MTFLAIIGSTCRRLRLFWQYMHNTFLRAAMTRGVSSSSQNPSLMDKLETLRSSLSSRDDEIMTYQINIDNYERAVARINAEHSGNPAMIEFRDALSEMLLSTKTEQLKAVIIRDVIADQITEMESN